MNSYVKRGVYEKITKIRKRIERQQQFLRTLKFSLLILTTYLFFILLYLFIEVLYVSKNVSHNINAEYKHISQTVEVVNLNSTKK